VLTSLNGGTFTKRAAAFHLQALLNDHPEVLQAALTQGSIALIERALKQVEVTARLSDGTIIAIPKYMSFGNEWRSTTTMTTAQYQQHLDEDRTRVQYDRDALARKEQVLAELIQRGAGRVSDVLILPGDDAE
jgi:hypothetical protein